MEGMWMARTIEKAEESLEKITAQRETLEAEAAKLGEEKRDLLVRIEFDGDTGKASKRLAQVNGRLNGIAVALGDLAVQSAAVEEERTRLVAVQAAELREQWQARYKELAQARDAAYQKVTEAFEVAADALQDYRRACDAPAREAGKYAQQSEPFRWRPAILLHDLQLALRRRGITIG